MINHKLKLKALRQVEMAYGNGRRVCLGADCMSKKYASARHTFPLLNVWVCIMRGPFDFNHLGTGAGGDRVEGNIFSSSSTYDFLLVPNFGRVAKRNHGLAHAKILFWSFVECTYDNNANDDTISKIEQWGGGWVLVWTEIDKKIWLIPLHFLSIYNRK